MRYATRATASILCAVAAALFSGCVAGREYGSAAPVFNLPDKTAPVQVTDPDIAKAFEARPQLTLPSEVALFEQTYPSWQHRVPQNEMADEIKGLLEGSPAFSKVLVISPSFLSGPVTPRTVRLAAAYHKSPLTLLCDADFRVSVRYSPLSILNLTIIGALIVPSTTVEDQTRVGVHLMDTRNGYVYYSGIRTKTWKRFLPSGWGEGAVEEHRRLLTRECYEELILELKQELMRATQPRSEPGK